LRTNYNTVWSDHYI